MGNRFNIDGLGVFGIITGALSLGYAAWQSYKLNKIANKMDMTLEEVEKKSKIDIEQELVDSVVTHTVQRKVDKATVDTISAVKADLHQTISSKVQKEVDNQYKTLSDEVAEQISKNVAAISESKLADQVLPRVERKLTEKGEIVISRVENDMRSKLSKSMDFIGATTDVIRNATLGKLGNNGGGRSIKFDLD